MDHLDIEELADARYEELKEVVPTLNELEACDLRDLLYARRAKILRQLQAPTRNGPDGVPLDADEYRFWKIRARDALSHSGTAYRLVKTQLRRISIQRGISDRQESARFAEVQLGGTMGLMEALYLMALHADPVGGRTHQQQMTLLAARQVLANAKRQKVGA